MKEIEFLNFRKYDWWTDSSFHQRVTRIMMPHHCQSRPDRMIGTLRRAHVDSVLDGLLSVCHKYSAPIVQAYWALLKTFSLNSLTLYFSSGAGDPATIYPDMSLIDRRPLKWLFIRLCGFFIVFNCLSIGVRNLCTLKSLLDRLDQSSLGTAHKPKVMISPMQIENRQQVIYL